MRGRPPKLASRFDGSYGRFAWFVGAIRTFLILPEAWVHPSSASLRFSPSFLSPCVAARHLTARTTYSRVCTIVLCTMVSLNIDPTTGLPINEKPFKLEDHPVDDSGRKLRIAISEWSE